MRAARACHRIPRRLRLHRITVPPGAIPAGKRLRVKASAVQLERHTGARPFVGSGAVRHDQSPGLLERIGRELVGRDADAAGDLAVVALVLGTASDVQDDRGVGSA